MFGATNQVRIEVTTDGEQATRVFGNMARELGRMEGESVKVSRSFQQMGINVKDLVRLFGVWEGFKFFRSQSEQLVRVASDFQKIERSMERFAGSSEEAREQAKWLEDLGQQAFGIRTLERAFVSLEHVGLKPTREQLEGLMGYMLETGKTSSHEFSQTISKMTQLYQLGNVGIDDALKELSQHVPFLMSALRDKLNVSYLDLMQDFKKRNISFAQIIGSVLDYAQENFREGIPKTEHMWDVLWMRLESKIEYFRKRIAESGPFETLNMQMLGAMKGMDRYFQSDAFGELVDRVSGDLSGFLDTLGATDLSTQDVADGITAMSGAMRNAAPFIKDTASFIGDAATALDGLLRILNAGGSAGTAATYGILGTALFGLEAGAVIAAIKLVYDNSTSVSNMLQETQRTLELANGKVPGAIYKRGGAANAPDLFQDWAVQQKESMSQLDEIEEGTKRAEFLSMTAFNKLGQTRKLGKSAFDQMVQGSDSAGLNDYQRFEAQQKARDAEMQNFFNGEQDSINEMKEIFILEKGRMDQVDELQNDLNWRRSKWDKALQKTLAAERAKWAEKAGFGVTDFINKVGKATTGVGKTSGSLSAESMALSGDVLGAERQRIIAQTDALKEQTENTASELDAAYQKMYAKLRDAGMLGTPAGKSAVDSIKAAMRDFYDATDALGAQAEQTKGEKLFNVEWTSKFTRQEALAQLRNQYTGLTGTMEEQLKTEAKLIQATSTRTSYQEMLNGATQEETSLREKIAEEQVRVKNLMADGSFGAGWQYAYGEYFRNLDTNAERGKKAFETLQDAISQTGAILTEFAMTGKINFSDFADSLISDMIRIQLQDVLMKTVFSPGTFLGGFLSNPFGLFGGPTNVSAGGASWNSSLNFLEHHSGGMVTGSGKLRNLPAALLAFAPRLHSGLAADEFPAILQRGEEVVSKKNAGRSGGVTVVNHFNLPSEGFGKDVDAGQAMAVAKLIGSQIDAKITAALSKQLKPGGILNRGLNG